MNCKPGDLAIVVAVDTDNYCDLGKLVRVVRAGDDWSVEPYNDSRPHWAVDTLGQKLVASEQGNHLNFSDGVERIDIPDACLKPIRDNDSKDETLKWAPVPVKEAAC